jgi:uncharacterized protein YidB (DUF937 family)
MSMFGDLVGKLTGKEGGAALMGVVTALIERAGGLQALLGLLEKNGLGAQIASWVGQGANQPVSGSQLGQALEQGGLGSVIRDHASQLGLGEGALNDQLAKLLPEAVNHLTPDGDAAVGKVDLGGLGALAGKLFG